MKANELRIGNLVMDEYADGSLHQVEVGIEQIEYPHNCQPIPLTEEWLERFGFELTDNGYKRKGRSICLIKKPNGFLVSIWGRNIHLGVKHVHQLQNLYFALTSEQLG